MVSSQWETYNSENQVLFSNKSFKTIKQDSFLSFVQQLIITAQQSEVVQDMAFNSLLLFYLFKTFFHFSYYTSAKKIVGTFKFRFLMSKTSVSVYKCEQNATTFCFYPTFQCVWKGSEMNKENKKERICIKIPFSCIAKL